MAVSEKNYRLIPARLRARPIFQIGSDTRLKLKKAGIILLVLAAAVGVGLATGGEKEQLYAGLALGGILGLAGMVFLTERTSWGVLLLMIAAAYTPFSVGTGTGSRIVDSLIVAVLFVGLWILRMLVVERRFHLTASPVNAPLLLFMVACVISLIWGTTFRDPQVVIWSSFPFVQLASTVVMVMLPASFLYIANKAQNEKMLKWIAWLLVLAGVIGLASHFLKIDTVNTGGLMSTWAVAVSVAMALFYEKLGRPLRLALLLHAGGWILWGFVLNISWVAGWLPIMLVTGIIALMRSRKLAFTLVAILFVVAFVFRDYYIARIKDETNVSGVTRVGAWEVNWRVTGQHILFGTGPGGYAAYYMTYWPNQGLATHNNYIDLVSQTGVVGTVFYLWAFGAILWQGYRLTRRLRGRHDFLESLATAAFAGTIACLVLMAFGDWLLPFAYTQTIAGFDSAVISWMFMGTIIAIDAIVPANESRAQNA